MMLHKAKDVELSSEAYPILPKPTIIIEPAGDKDAIIRTLRQQEKEFYDVIKYEQERANRAVEVLKELLPFVEEQAEHEGYGFARPQNPHDYTPDPECCSPNEVKNWQEACKAFDAGRPIQTWGWGIGSYVYRNEEFEQLRDRMRELIGGAK